MDLSNIICFKNSDSELINAGYDDNSLRLILKKAVIYE